MDINNITAAKLPKVFYSTWGEGSYSKSWIDIENYWMFSIAKFIEENITLAEDRNILSLFEKFTASDYPFIYTGLEQRKYAEDKFISYLTQLISNIEIKKREVITSFPVDPFWCYFSYVVLNDDSQFVEGEDIRFNVYKLGCKASALLQNKKFNELHVRKITKANFTVYFQNFILYPNLYYLFEVPGKNLSLTFKMPEQGMPFVIAEEEGTVFLYKYEKLYKHLKEIWGPAEELPVLNINEKRHAYRRSNSIFQKEQLNRILPDSTKAAVFKYNKESYSLIRFQNLSPLNPSIIFDDRVSIKDAGEYINLANTGISVTNNCADIKDTDFNVLVFTCSINYESELEIIKKLVSKAVKNSMPVISLYDDILQYSHIQNLLSDDITGNFYKVIAAEQDLKNLDVERYFEYKPKKVLGLFGTDSVQGKFTTQILLREELKKFTNVKHFSTEPTGILVGADVAFSRVESQTEEQSIAFHRKVISDLEERNDIIITGGQNSIILDQFGDKDITKNVSTRIFKAFLPKWMILTVSVDTSMDTVLKSLSYLETLNKTYNMNTEVIALSMLIGRKIRGERWTETYFVDVNKNIVESVKEKIERVTGIKVFITPDEIGELAKKIVTYL